MNLDQYIAVDFDADCSSPFDQNRPVANRYRSTTTHLGCRRVLDSEDFGHGAGAAQGGEDVADILHVGKNNINHVSLST